MRAFLAAVLTVAILAASLQAAEAGAPKLSGPLDTPTLSEPLAMAAFFNITRFLTNAGFTYSASPSLMLEPELGFGYRGAGQELHGGLEQSTHRLDARAGWRLSLAEALHFSAAAKLPMVTVEKTGLYAGEELGTRPDARSRAAYDFINLSHAPLRWTGELGLHLTPRTDLMLYYDQNPLNEWYYPGRSQEERVGTRFIIRFK